MSADIFVDRTGRRRRVLGWLAVASAALLVGALGLLATGVLTGSPLPLPGWSGAESGAATPGPDSAVIGPAPPPAVRPTADPADPADPADQPTSRPRRTTTPAATAGSADATDHPGRGVGRSNRPTARPDHPQPKAG